MPPTSIAEWDNEYARLARAASQIRSGVVAGGAADLPSGLQRLEAALQHLPLQPTEIQRRRRLVQHLQQTTTTTSTTTTGGAGQAQSQMQLAMQQQDAMIDDLAVGVGRLKHQTHAISDEAGMHVNLLNDMETNLDAAQQGLEDETRRAARLKEDQSVWRLQLIVAGLSVLLVLLIVMGISP
uniref:t-SNARE coiled-coil homology domain-containing protein n=1 Tax=Amphora coffeiformis TaxID=265554 RepID=A0A7S3PCT6_9STRA|mmetsp:Transcript_9241/g.17667  ORF Transcript_9241/g.17667 Transcript_9241/m.17667 type:complete len:182 (-) Transcript_9241:137-682(-)